MARPMTHRERRAAHKAWDAFQPDNQYGNYVVCTFVEENQAWEVLREQAREFVPERFWHKIEWIRELLDPTVLADYQRIIDKEEASGNPAFLDSDRSEPHPKDLSIAWSYIP